MARKTPEKFIQKAIKRPGALTKKVGGPPSENLEKVRKLAKVKGRTGAQARFFLNVLRPLGLKRKKKAA